MARTHAHTHTGHDKIHETRSDVFASATMAALCAAGSAGAPPPHASGECRPGPDLRYGINVSKIENASVVLRFVQLGEDDETRTFMRNFCSGAENEWTDSAAAAMKKYMSLTDANAILDRGKMFVLSATHARRLLQGSFPADGSADEWSPRTLLDIGAGDGSTTLEIMRAIQGVPEKVCATEASKSMAWRLRQKGFECVETCDLGHAKFERQQDGGTFDVIMCLNVLDRAIFCTLLRDIRRRMKPGSSRLLIAMVLPFALSWVRHKAEEAH